MKIYARIENNLVQELVCTNDDITKMFNAALIWMDTGASGAQVGWSVTLAKGAFLFYPPPSPSEVDIIIAANAMISNQICCIEQQHLMNRGCRESWLDLLLQQAVIAGKTEDWLLDEKTGSLFYIKLKAINAEINALRTKLRQL